MRADARSIERLAKVCGMFGSDQLGERAAAAARAESIRQQMGVTWADLLAATGREQPLPDFDPRLASPPALLARCAPVLTDWEREFLASIGSQRTYTLRQTNRLEIIRNKCAAWWANGGRA